MKKPDFKYEKRLWKKDIKYVIGIDEVGRGAFAGPIVAAGVIFQASAIKLSFIKKINDSKLLKPSVRERLSKEIIKNCMHYSIQEVGVEEINKFGIGQANNVAFLKAISDLLSQIGESENYFLLTDGYPVKDIDKQMGIIGGDGKSITIAAASIIAKVYRDSLMRKLGRFYPSYRFAKNKGYGTKFHQNALKLHGLSEIHRTSFDLSRFIA